MECASSDNWKACEICESVPCLRVQTLTRNNKESFSVLAKRGHRLPKTMKIFTCSVWRHDLPSQMRAVVSFDPKVSESMRM